jgi:hypothetical protein
MEKQVKTHVSSDETSIVMTSNETGSILNGMQEEIRNMAESRKQQFHDLTRLHIERNRATRHARCAIMRIG